MQSIRKVVPVRWTLNRIATMATLLLFRRPSGATGQVSETLASSAHPDAAGCHDLYLLDERQEWSSSCSFWLRAYNIVAP
jgi:hypothetical protein